MPLICVAKGNFNKEEPLILAHSNNAQCAANAACTVCWKVLGHAIDDILIAVSKIVRPKKHQRKSPLIPRMLEEPPLALSQEGLLKLQKLMTEGDLMEVSLEETNVIWRILQATKPSHLQNKLLDEEEESEADSEALKNVPDSVERAKRTYDDLSTSNGSTPSTSSGFTPAVKKMKTKNPRFLNKNKKTTDNEALWPKQNKRGTRRDSTKSKLNRKRIRYDKDVSTDEDEDEGNEELCAALVCRRPTGSEVDWVQCDGGCEQWFHMHCVGLVKHEINEDEDYICKQCYKPEIFVKEEMDLSEIKTEPLDIEDDIELASLFTESGDFVINQ